MKPSDFIVEHNPFIAADADKMHRDNEVQMARADLYHSADYAIKLHKILRGVSDSTDMEQWVMEKISIANENLRTVYEYLNYEAQEQEGAMPGFAFESAEKQYEEILEEDWKSALAGGALAASMALGGMGAAHADEVPRDVPAASAQADNSLASRFTPGIDFSSTPYTINANGKEFKFAGRNADAPDAKGQTVKVPAALIGIRSLKAVKVILSPDGKYYSSPELDEGTELKKAKRLANQAAKDANNDQVGAGKKIDTMKNSMRQKDVNKVKESCDAGATGAGAVATGAVGAIAPQRRVKEASAATKKYGNAMKTKAPKIGKGVY